MNYSFLISQMTWSFSRLTAFEKCRYGFLLKYLEEEPEQPTYFASYGKLMHQILEQYHNGTINKDEAIIKYYSEYGNLPHDISSNVYTKYYEEGKKYLENIQPVNTILATEQKIDFDINGHKFVGYIDRIDANKNGYDIIDYKTRIINTNFISKRTKKPTKHYELFVQYARQLYMYSIATEQLYGKPPDKICFHCFRDGSWATEQFNKEQQNKVTQWADDLIETITYNEDWSPNIDWFSCRYICGFYNVCEYARTNFM